jgi:Na+/proline symporter
MIIPKEKAIITGTLGGLYEIIPGFLLSLLVCIVVAKLTAAPGEDVEKMFDRAVEMVSEDDPEDLGAEA